jgi:poly(A) polymerase
LGRPVTDIDLATTHPPERVVQLLEAAGLKAVPTGIDHGTITAVAGGRPFEITTLRHDVATDGRRAEVAYTDDWAADAARRDFTLNALYADAQGRISDPVGGLADLKARRVRFIGDAATRIREDYLRILRFFRIHAVYGEGDFDPRGLAACATEKGGLERLSGERVQSELLKLLAAEDPVPALQAMDRSGVLGHVLPGPVDFGRFQGLVRIERGVLKTVDALRRLGSLLAGGGSGAAKLAAALRLSNADRTRLVAMESGAPVGLDLPPAAVRARIYREGKPIFLDRAVLAWAEASPDFDAEWQGFYERAAAFEPPAFPITGKDAKAAGVREGPEIGRVLKMLEDEWAQGDFSLSRQDLLQRLEAIAG